jgi:hypothetical protein
MAAIPVHGSSMKLPGFGVQGVTTVIAYLAQPFYRSAQRLCHALAFISSCYLLALYIDSPAHRLSASRQVKSLFHDRYSRGRHPRRVW